MEDNRLLVYNDINTCTFDKNRNTKQKNKEALLNTKKKIWLEVNAEKTKYAFMFHYRNTEKVRNLVTTNKSDENEAKCKYFRTTATDRNCIHEEIKSRLNSGNACYHQFRIFCLPVSSLKT